MIDYLTFIEELKGLKKKALNPETRNITLEFNKLIEKYEKRVSENESETAPKEEVDILKMSPNRDFSFMSNYQEGGAGYDDTKEYEENSEGDIVPVEQKNDLTTDLETTTELLNQKCLTFRQDFSIIA